MTEQTGIVTCKYPGCDNPEHTGVTAWRERKRLADAERGITTTEAEADQPVTMARVTGAELLRQMRDMAGTLAATAERLTGAVTTMTDPAEAEVEIEAARAAA